MKLFNNGPGHWRRTVATAAATAVLGLLGAGLGAAPAAASESSYSDLAATSSGYALDVPGSSTAWGTDFDVWYYNGTNNQLFNYPETNGQISTIANLNSGQCVTTDGVAGDPVYQFPCVNSPGQMWEAEVWTAWWNLGKTMVTFLNPASGLVLEVRGDSYAPGAEVDAWPPNGGLNQSWTLPACTNEYVCD